MKKENYLVKGFKNNRNIMIIIELTKLELFSLKTQINIYNKINKTKIEILKVKVQV